ncbi:hypothetical protein [Rhizobium mongolense]
MTTHDYNPLFTLYGAPRAVVHARVSVRAKPDDVKREQGNPEKIGSSR